MDSTTGGTPARGLAALHPTRREAAFLAVATGATLVAGHNDLEWSRRIIAHDSRAAADFSSVVRPFGAEVVFAGGAAAYGAGWLTHRAWLRDAARRADLSMLAAAVSTFTLKQIVGRKRPDDSPGDTRAFEPFSGNASFPSGHATVAFAAAAVLDRETTSRWVPAIAYPLAGAVLWSRVHDREHWMSDVVAGAAIGFGVAWKAEDVQRGRASGAQASRLGLTFGGAGTLASVQMTW